MLGVLTVALCAACDPASQQRDDVQGTLDAARMDAAMVDSAPADRTAGEGGAADRATQDATAADLLARDHTAQDLGGGLDASPRDHAMGVDSAVVADASQATDASTADLGTQCQAVPDPVAVPESPLPGEASAGTSETTSVNGFTDDYLYNATSYTKVGVRREWGGTLIFFGLVGSSGPGQNSSNVIDANDTGREVQVAFYDPDRAMQNCAHDASCRTTSTTCPQSITYLGWNPVQGGNRCNVGSGVLSCSNANGLLEVNTQPLHWNPNWDRQDCSDVACSDSQLRQRRSEVTVRQRARFVRPLVVELDYLVDNPDSMAHASTLQEMPTVYTSNGQQGPDLWRLYDSSQTQISIDQPGNDGFFYKNLDSPGAWVSLQNETSDYGVGMYYENRQTAYQGWQNRSLPFNNFRARFAFGIPAHAQVRARAYLILGSLQTVAAEASWLDTHLPPFGWLDAPVADATVQGNATVGGWALDNKGVTAVELWVDGALHGSLGYGGSRPDVCLVWPGYAGCNQVGFSGTLDTSALTACQHLLEIVARDGDGNQRVIARRRVSVTR
ncbi:MAG: Ig-like domain-containing protein [Pseudomonadota bacterium]